MTKRWGLACGLLVLCNASATAQGAEPCASEAARWSLRCIEASEPAAHFEPVRRQLNEAPPPVMPRPAIHMTRAELDPLAPTELRSLDELCRVVWTYRISRRVPYMLELHPRAPEVYWNAHRAYREIAEHMVRNPDLQFPRVCAKALSAL